MLATRNNVGSEGVPARHRIRGEVFGHGGLMVVGVPATLLGERRAMRVRLDLGDGRRRALAFRSGDVSAVVVPSSCPVGSTVEGWLEPEREPSALVVPPDVRLAFIRAHADIGWMKSVERRQALLLIYEARGAAVRSHRISALASVCTRSTDRDGT
ncbi:hypothetical protein [Tenggerimyces flavus]|uniref:Uncharacterized protein n=1 Tax=Tenggerimyces flavus TaxID=1708749 RepID=A0ABV7YJR3_9ACTN|nr:hypothetical protein [Tenggerimyces flavus]MBM7789563.1 hypothetical protein [Tenggerimyces flavus]